MNRTNICWCTHTFNPVAGCLRGCKDFECYAEKLHNKRHRAYFEGKKLSKRYAHPFNEMHYYPESFKNQPKKSKVIKKVFVGSMSDICYWEPKWIRETTAFCKERPEIEFMFLTKDPSVYYLYYFPRNCWLGVTITIKRDDYRLYQLISFARDNKKFISIEPLLGKIKLDFKLINLVIIGADSSKNPVIPKKEWIDSIKHPNIHYKKNIEKYL
jgi:protein gp37